MTPDYIVDVLRIAITLVGGVVSPLVLTIGFALVGVIRRSRTFMILAGANTIALWIAYSVETPIGIAVWIASFALTWIGIFHEPLWLARRLGLVRRSIPFEFDHRLGAVVNDFGDVIRRANEAQLSEVERDAFREEGERLLQTLRSLAPPNAEWASLAGAYEELFEIDLDGLFRGLTEEQVRRFTEVRDRLPETLESLRVAYRAEAKAQFYWP